MRCDGFSRLLAVASTTTPMKCEPLNPPASAVVGRGGGRRRYQHPVTNEQISDLWPTSSVPSANTFSITTAPRASSLVERLPLLPRLLEPSTVPALASSADPLAASRELFPAALSAVSEVGLLRTSFDAARVAGTSSRLRPCHHPNPQRLTPMRFNDSHSTPTICQTINSM